MGPVVAALGPVGTIVVVRSIHDNSCTNCPFLRRRNRMAKEPDRLSRVLICGWDVTSFVIIRRRRCRTTAATVGDKRLNVLFEPKRRATERYRNSLCGCAACGLRWPTVLTWSILRTDRRQAAGRFSFSSSSGSFHNHPIERNQVSRPAFSCAGGNLELYHAYPPLGRVSVCDLERMLRSSSHRDISRQRHPRTAVSPVGSRRKMLAGVDIGKGTAY